jgi:hypothetical protein
VLRQGARSVTDSKLSVLSVILFKKIKKCLIHISIQRYPYSYLYLKFFVEYEYDLSITYRIRSFSYYTSISEVFDPILSEYISEKFSLYIFIRF